MFCTNCGTEIKDDDKFCTKCGTPNEMEPKEVFCTKCGTKLDKGEKFCGECGTKVEEEAVKAEVFSSVLETPKEKTNNIIFDPKDEKQDDFHPTNGNYQSRYRDNKKKSKAPLIVGLALIVLVAILVPILLATTVFSNPYKGKRTVMVYMIGADLETKGFAATRDINEMINSNANFENVSVIVYTGGAKKWHMDDIPNDKHAIFKVTKDGIEKLEEFDNAGSMTKGSNLTYFLKYGYDNFKAEYYSLILWDHGSGPIYGYGADEYYPLNYPMGLSELKNALYDSPFSGENKLEFIGFDACLMGSFEVANAIQDYADYLIASEETEPGAGWDYSFLGDIKEDTETVEIGKNIIDKFDSYYQKLKYINGTSLSLLKLSKVENVEKYFNRLFNELDQNLDVDFSILSRSRKASKAYGRDPSSSMYVDVIDLYDLLKNLPSKYSDDASNLSSALQDFVVYQKTDLEGTNGLSIYFPYETKTAAEINYSLNVYKGFGFAKDYYSFITNFVAKLKGTRRNNFDLTKSAVKSSGEGNISISLSDEVINNYSSAEYVLFIKNADNTYTPIYRGYDIEVDGKTMSITTSRKILVIKDEQGNELNLTAIESERGKNYIKYNIPVTLTHLGDNYEYELVNAYVEFIVDDENPNGYMGAIKPMASEETHTTPRTELNIEDYEFISFNSYSYNIFDGSGNYKKDWDSSDKITNMMLNTKDTYTIEFRDIDISNDYYALFKIEDSQGFGVYSNVVLVNNK